MSDDYGPRWCVNSQEMGTGIILYVVIVISVFSVLPAFFIGWGLASKLWDVKIFKYPVAFLMALGYGMGLCMLYPLSKILTISIIVFAWLLLDYFFSHRVIKQMWLIRTIGKCLRWLFSK